MMDRLVSIQKPCPFCGAPIRLPVLRPPVFGDYWGGPSAPPGDTRVPVVSAKCSTFGCDGRLEAVGRAVQP